MKYFSAKLNVAIERALAVDHHRLLVRDREGGVASTATATPACSSVVEGVVVGAAPGGAVRVQHDAHRDAAPMRVEQGLDDPRLVERELDGAERRVAPRDQVEHRLDAVVGLDDQAEIRWSS